MLENRARGPGKVLRRMTTVLQEQIVKIPPGLDAKELLRHFRGACEDKLEREDVPVRFVVAKTDADGYSCEIAVLRGGNWSSNDRIESIFRFRRRLVENTDRFNVVLLVPTGIGAEIGGHAGDAGPVARMLSQLCDTLILHPNVVNASDVNEMPDNSLYVEGSVVTRLLMGTAGLQPVRANRILMVLAAHEDEFFLNAAINTVSAARAAYGLTCSEVALLDPPLRMRGRFAASGRAAGYVEHIDALLDLLTNRSGQYDALALSSVIDVRHELHEAYFAAAGAIVNPWGGVEAMLTHTLSSIYNVPAAHSPMLESREICDLDPGIVDARMAAEAFSTTFLQCTLKGLRQSPRIVTDGQALHCRGVIAVEDISCLVIPDGCLGLPTLAALEQGIPVIAVRENANLMRNELSNLPWSEGQFLRVKNYWEAAGVLATMRAGIDPVSVRRPLPPTFLSEPQYSDDVKLPTLQPVGCPSTVIT